MDGSSEISSPLARNAARVSRYAQVDLEGITVTRATTEADLELVASLREKGYSRFSSDHTAAVEWVDAVDRDPANRVLIAWNDNGRPLATMRMQDGRGGGEP